MAKKKAKKKVASKVAKRKRPLNFAAHAEEDHKPSTLFQRRGRRLAEQAKMAKTTKKAAKKKSRG